jgi:ADP-heptose:LPS heptosyltransferase
MKEITLSRFSGLGDVCMMLSAAHALKNYGFTVNVGTNACFYEICRACPHVGKVFIWPNVGPNTVNLAEWHFGLSKLHQVDAYLAKFGVPTELADKTLDLVISDSSFKKFRDLPSPAPGKQRVLIHPAQGDPNRTWSLENWDTVVNHLLDEGHQVIVIGADSIDNKSFFKIQRSVVDYTNTLSHLDTVALCRLSDVLISSDTGPIQLAGASEIRIIGLYTVIGGANRKPFRLKGDFVPIESTCSFSPCYFKMLEGEYWGSAQKALDAGTTNLGEIFRNWCPKGGFSCGITPEMVLKVF